MSMIYNRVERIEVTRKPVRSIVQNKSIRESANALRQTVLLTIGAIAVIAWSIALGALI